MQEVRAREAQQVEEKARLVNGLKTAAQIEDELLQEDVQRCTSNHQSQGITLFNPHLRAMSSNVAAPRTRVLNVGCQVLSSENKFLPYLETIQPKIPPMTRKAQRKGQC